MYLKKKKKTELQSESEISILVWVWQPVVEILWFWFWFQITVSIVFFGFRIPVSFFSGFGFGSKYKNIFFEILFWVLSTRIVFSRFRFVFRIPVRKTYFVFGFKYRYLFDLVLIRGNVTRYFWLWTKFVTVSNFLFTNLILYFYLKNSVTRNWNHIRECHVYNYHAILYASRYLTVLSVIRKQ